MSNLPASVMSHVSLGTNDYPRAKAFYDAVLATLQIRCVMDFPGGAGYGREFPEFWVQTPFDGGRASVGNGVLDMGAVVPGSQWPGSLTPSGRRSGKSTRLRFSTSEVPPALRFSSQPRR